MKILHITNGFGGEAEMTRKIATFLERCHNNTILATKKGAGSESLNFSVFMDEEIPNVKGVTKYMGQLRVSDIVFIHNIFNYCSLLLVAIGVILRKRIICVLHNNIEGIDGGLKSKYLLIRKLIIVNTINIFSCKMVFITTAQKNGFRKLAINKKRFDNKFHIIPDFIDSSIIKSNIEDFAITNVVYVGRFSAYKGFPDLLKIINDNRLSDINFTLIGGEYESERKNIKVFKSLSNNDVIQELDKNQILIVTTYSEVFSVAILEALSRGLVIVTTDFAGIEELIKEEVNGYIYKKGDTEKAVGILNYLKNNHAKLKQIQQNNIKLASVYDSERVGAMYIDLLEKL